MRLAKFSKQHNFFLPLELNQTHILKNRLPRTNSFSHFLIESKKDSSLNLALKSNPMVYFGFEPYIYQVAMCKQTLQLSQVRSP